MKAKELKVGDLFRVVGETEVRKCLFVSNPDRHGIVDVKFGFQHKPDYWCWMGQHCEVEIVERRR